MAWGVLTLATGFVPALLAASAGAAIVGLMVVRFLMGMTHAPIFPVSAGAFARWFPVGHWAFPNAMQSVGLGLGQACVGPLVTVLIVAFGWRASFYCLAPLAFLLRSAVLVPLGAVIPPLRRLVWERFSALSINPAFRRRPAEGEFARQVLWQEVGASAWALALLASVAWLGFGALLLAQAIGDSSPSRALQILAWTFAAHAAVTIVGSRGRHLAWIPFGTIAVLAWLAASG